MSCENLAAPVLLLLYTRFPGFLVLPLSWLYAPLFLLFKQLSKARAKPPLSCEPKPFQHRALQGHHEDDGPSQHHQALRVLRGPQARRQTSQGVRPSEKQDRGRCSKGGLFRGGVVAVIFCPCEARGIGGHCTCKCPNFQFVCKKACDATHISNNQY